MLTKKQVEHIAKLSRIEISENEIEKYQRDLGGILDYIEKLNEVRVDDIEPTSHIVGSENFIREDKKISECDYGSLVSQAPNFENDYFKVKAIL